ncbi:glycoside hydrolase family 15 protein [Niveispirillum fermenti]|uniref:glycoside hydrolase family 15 protein n=1 Tax=Niveispirillum fermenti TaxID=1233113 RepID=UPI003A88F7F3
MPEAPLPRGIGKQGPQAAKTALDRLFDHVNRVILSRQHPITGLLPASTAVTVHGNYTHAWVRDNVYSIIGPWALSLAYRRRGDSAARARLLEQSVVKTMRGLLQAMMRQAAKVERFKQTQAPLDSLHAIYSASTGEAVAADDGWGHLQIDATSLFLLMLAQMTRSGMSLIYTMDEVAFVQNLVHYIGPAYRIADFGIWERGRKINDGAVELNASSIGMAKAAMEAMQGLDLFGEDGGRVAVIHAVPDEIARARATVEALLPRESGSKEVDAALLAIIGWPGFAVDVPDLVERTRAEILSKLGGPYGCKRFLTDGHQTVLEDHSRLHYEAGELERFRGIESEWPLFFTYFYVTALLTGDARGAAQWRERLEGLLVERGSDTLLPELYIVPADTVEAERASPGSQARIPNDNVPLLWAQSLFIMGLLLDEGYLSAGDVDPLNRRAKLKPKPPVPLRLVVLAEDEPVQAELRGHGVFCQTLSQGGGSIHICHVDVLVGALAELGRCEALGLSGRPPRRLGTLITANGFRFAGQPAVIVPTFVDEQDGFYFTYDHRFLVERLLSEIAYINRTWTFTKPPLLVFPVSKGMAAGEGFAELARTLADLLAGRVPDLVVRGGDLADTYAGSRIIAFDQIAPSCPVSARPVRARDAGAGFDFAAPPPGAEDRRWIEEGDTPWLARSLDGERRADWHLLMLSLLWQRQGRDFVPDGDSRPLWQRAEDLYRAAGHAGHWDIVRPLAWLMDRHDERLQDAVKEIVVRQKHVILGDCARAGAVVDRPLANAEISHRLAAIGGDPATLMLREEMLLFSGTLIKASPELFRYTLSARPADLLGLLVRSVGRQRGVSEAAALEMLKGEGPHTILTRLRRLISRCPGMTGDFCLPVLSRACAVDRPEFAMEGDHWSAHILTGGDWWGWRDTAGTLLPVPDEFFHRVWGLLRHGDGLIIADPTNHDMRLDSATLRADRTPGERDFAREVESRLDRIMNPEYRQLTVEALWAVSEMLSVHSEVRLPGLISTDRIIATAVARHWSLKHPGIGDPNGATAWKGFYNLSPVTAAEHLATGALMLAGLADGVPDAA